MTDEDCEEAIDSAFECMEEKQFEKYYERLEKMEEKVDALFNELDALALSSELHK